MSMTGPDALPALFRAGDIGVSSEWRDITYDWAPVLTADGVFIYSYLRDMFDNQRILRPFLLAPDGPTKQRIQRVLGRKSAYAIQGPEYLLKTVGLLHVEVQRGASSDPDRPWHTTAAYYVVGRLDHPILDWTMLGRVLDALMVALASSDGAVGDERHKPAEAALRSLGNAGMLQNVDPDDMFDPDGAWPALLPTLIHDPRWERLFAHLHGVEAIRSYREQARAWVEWAQRRSERAMQHNLAIREQILAAQRKGPPRGGPTFGAQGHGGLAAAGTVSLHGTPVASTRVPEAGEIATRPPVPGKSPTSLQGIEVTSTAPETGGRSARGAAQTLLQTPVSGESLPLNQNDRMKTQIDRCNIEGPETGTGTTLALVSGTRSGDGADESLALAVAAHVRDDELSSTRQDGHFWRAFQQILHGTDERYAFTAGEKKAAYRLFKRSETPVGVVLAALRAVMTLPPAQRPRSFGAALTLPIFHEAVARARALLPTRPAAEATGGWPAFLQTYRSIGQAEHLRDVAVPEYHLLLALFERQPEACWEVLHRAQSAAQPPQLSPEYLRKAISNNQRAAALDALRPASRRRDPTCEPAVPRPNAGASSAPDPRRRLLEQQGINPRMLTDEMSLPLIEAWIAEADVRRHEISKRAGWIAWGIRSERFPHEHPALRPRPHASPPPAPRAGLPAAGSHPHGAAATLWPAVLAALQQQMPQQEFDTWLGQSRLVALDSDAALVGVPNIFVRDQLMHTYVPLIADTLGALVGRSVAVQVVLDC